MDVIRQAVNDRHLTSRWAKVKQETTVSLREEGGTLSDMVHFGSINSRVSAVAYNKAKEQLQVGGHWVRFELRGKQEGAEQLVKAFLLGGFTRMASVLGTYVDFKQPGQDSNKSRWQTVAWWSTFLGRIEKAPLFPGRLDRTVSQVRKWLVEQVAPSLALLFRADCGDLEWLLATIKRGDARLRQRHRVMLAAVLGPGGQEGLSFG
jgi:DNA relaxase NicK